MRNGKRTRANWPRGERVQRCRLSFFMATVYILSGQAMNSNPIFRLLHCSLTSSKGKGSEKGYGWECSIGIKILDRPRMSLRTTLKPASGHLTTRRANQCEARTNLAS